MSEEKINYDWSVFRDLMNLLHQYKIGDSYYLLKEGTILPVTIGKINAEIRDPGIITKTKRLLRAQFEISVYSDSYEQYLVSEKKLFKTKEEAAEAFLNANGVSNEAVKILKPNPTGTTVGDLIDRLSRIDPETNLAPTYQAFLDLIQDILNKPENTSE